jgi:hypothetical protein
VAIQVIWIVRGCGAAGDWAVTREVYVRCPYRQND